MGQQRTGRSERRPVGDDIAWEIDGERSIPRWADGDGDVGDASRRWGPAGEAAHIEDGGDGIGGGGGDNQSRAVSAERLRRWATRATGAALVLLVLFGLVRAYRGDRTHRLIQRDVQHVVQLEAEALAEGDRELYMSLQDERRRRILRRPDRAADERRTIGPFPGAYFTDDPPVVVGIEVSAKDSAHTVEAVTATVRVAATDGARVGRFEQLRRMVHDADGRWRHAVLPEADSRPEVDRFVSSRIHAAFPAADGPELRPLLAAANDAVDSYCAEQDRCTGRARFAFGVVDNQAADVALRLAAPSALTAWRPADETARDLLTFGIARAAVLRLDHVFSSRVRPDGTTDGAQPNWTIVTALVDASIAAHLDRSTIDLLAANTIAAASGLTLWHFERPVERPDWNNTDLLGFQNALLRRDLTIVARSFAATTRLDSPERLKAITARWPEELSAGRGNWLSSASIERDFGPGGLNALLDWPTRQAPFIADGATVMKCDGGAQYVVSRSGGVRDLSMLACDGGHVTDAAWSPDGTVLAVACVGRASETDPLSIALPSSLALVRLDAARGGWWAATTPLPDRSTAGLQPMRLDWAPDARHIAWGALIWTEGGLDAVARVGVVAVDPAADDPWPDGDAAWIEVPSGVPTAPDTADPPFEPAPGGMRPRWSPDGRTVAFMGRAGKIAVLPAGGQALRIVDGKALAWSPDGTRVALVALDASDPTPSEDAFSVHVLDAATWKERHSVRFDRASLARAAGGLSGRRPLNVRAVLDVAWSDDGQWLSTAFQTEARCGNGTDCVDAVAWRPGTTTLRAVRNAPQLQDGSWRWEWQAGWVDDSHSLAVFVAGESWPGRVSAVAGEAPSRAWNAPFRPDDGQADIDAEVAFVIDADTSEVRSVPRSESRTLATLLPDYSPDGRWHVRRDPMWRLIVEPVDGIGGFREEDPDSGWRFNRPFCSPYLAWSAGR